MAAQFSALLVSTTGVSSEAIALSFQGNHCSVLCSRGPQSPRREKNAIWFSPQHAHSSLLKSLHKRSFWVQWHCRRSQQLFCPDNRLLVGPLKSREISSGPKTESKSCARITKDPSFSGEKSGLALTDHFTRMAGRLRAKNRAGSVPAWHPTRQAPALSNYHWASASTEEAIRVYELIRGRWMAWLLLWSPRML